MFQSCTLQIEIEFVHIKIVILVPEMCARSLPLCNVWLNPIQPLSSSPVDPLLCDPKILVFVEQLTNNLTMDNFEGQCNINN